jgi:hypothetical protein
VSGSEPVVFKVEDTIWKVMQAGHKTWDARQVDLTDERFLRLFRCHWEGNSPPRQGQTYIPNEPYICFLNKDTGQTLQFRYRGVIQMNFAPGWCFFQLGNLVATIEPDGTVS